MSKKQKSNFQHFERVRPISGVSI